MTLDMFISVHDYSFRFVSFRFVSFRFAKYSKPKRWLLQLPRSQMSNSTIYLRLKLRSFPLLKPQHDINKKVKRTSFLMIYKVKTAQF